MTFDFSPVVDNWQFLAWGLWVTLALSALTMVLSTICGTAVALLRVYGSAWFRPLIVFYVDSVRSMPVMVIMVWAYFAFPAAAGIELSPFSAALAALTLQYSGYMSEIARAGIASVRTGQTRAGLALGMSRPQIVRRIILPQAVVRMLPSYGSMMAIIVKDSAVSSVIAVGDYLRRSTIVAAQTYHPVEVFTVAMAVYFLVIFPIMRSMDLFYKHVASLGRS